jgi:outer membrane protein assembly factor BamB
MARGISLVTLAYIAPLICADWNQFRGPNGSGVDSGTGYPQEFSPAKNVAWKMAVPYGQSSPVVANGRVFVTASEGDQLLTISFDAKSGRELWRHGIKRARSTKMYKANDPASPTPAADADGVIAFFGDYGLIAYNNDGMERWKLPLGPFDNFYGMASSPIVAGDLVIQLCDQQQKAFMLALDRTTGKQRWKTDRPGTTIGWGTPIVFRPAEGQAELIVLGTTRIDSYYLATGERRWWRAIGTSGGIGVPVTSRDAVFIATAGSTEPMLPTFASVLEKYDQNKDGKLSEEEFRPDKELGEHFGWIDANHDGFIVAAEWNEARQLGLGEFGAVAIQAGSSQGQLPDKTVRWRFQKNLPFMPSPLVYQDVFYMVKDGGIITSINASTGKVLKEGRTKDALGEYYASPVAADGKVYVVSVEGKMSVLKAGGSWEVLRVNDLGDEVHATPALAGGRIYVRTRSTLYCFAGS